VPSHDATPRGWRALPTLAVRTVRDSFEDRIFGLGAEVAFFILLSLPPALLAIFGLIGYVGEWFGEGVVTTIRDQVLSVAGSFLTESTRRDILQPTVDTLLRNGRADVASIGLALTLWSASRATSRLIEATSIAYDQPDERRAWKRRLLSLGLTIGGMVGIVVVIPVLVAGPRLLDAISEPLGITDAVAVAWRFLYWPIVGLLGVALLGWFYHLATPIKTRWRRELPGAVLAAGLWLLGGLGLRLYAELTLGSSTYGPLAAPIAFLLWMFVTAMAVLIGAELNAEIEKLWPSGAEPKDHEDRPEPPRAEAVAEP